MRAALLLSCCAVLCFPTTVLAWSPLRAENPNVKKGNALMAEKQYPEALDAYDKAARELPEERAVQLNRGLALLAQDLTDPAKEAFTAAADPSALPAVRADAYYDLGIAHARQGDALSEEESFEEATAQFREAAEAFKRSLRIQPGNRNAAWNLEYALQRIREEEEKREEQQEQNQEQNQEQDQEQEQEQGQEQEQAQEQEQGQEQEQEQEQEQGQEQEQEQGQEQEQEQGQDQSQERERSANESESRPSPSEVQRFLDALEQNEESLPLQRARRRSAGRRPPEKDW